MMRLSVVLSTRVVVSALGWIVVAVTPLAAEAAQEGADKLAIAESVIAREEAKSERAFDPSFRAKAKELLAALPLAELTSQTGEGGLGLSSLGDTQADLVYTPISPCRIIDTRVAGGPIAAGYARSFKVTGDTTFQGGKNCGIPFGPATSAMINFVAVNGTAPGDLRVTPFGTPMPEASILNWAGGVPGLNLANGLAVALCNPAATTCTNDITLQADASTIDVVADVQGYYQRVSTGGVGTALLADGAVTAPKIGSGVVVRSLNSLTDAVTLAAGSNVSITPSGSTLTISATPGGGGGDITAVNTPPSGGLQGGVTSGDADLGLVTCSASQVLKSGGAAWACATDADSGVTAVTDGGGITGSITARTLTLGSTATSANTPSAIVRRDASGNFSAGTITANLNGNATSATSFSGSLAGEVAGTQAATVVSNAVATNTANRIVRRDGSGSFLAGTVGLAGNLDIPDTTSASTGVLTKGGGPFLHNFGTSNAFLGAGAGNFTLTGVANCAFGWEALISLATGNYNIAVGYQPLSQLSSGNTNIAIGMNAGANLTTGSNNIYIGEVPGNNETGMIRIGSGFTTSDTYVAGIYARGAASGAAVYVSPDGKLGTSTSSRRYKEQIADMNTESDVLMKLRPVSFYYRPELDETHTRQYGLVAEEVAELAPDLVAYDKDGAPQMVRYHFVNAMLLNEVQKQRATIRTQESKMQDLEERLARLEAALATDR
jgi:Chaperone of endosialidase